MAPVGRGKAKGVPAATRTFQAAEVKEVCPLCIEELDETDLTFKPCPCGYRVCLFCFEKLKLHCRGLCPGCRREFGKVDEASPDTKPPSAASEVAASVGDATSNFRPAAAQPSASTSGRPSNTVTGTAVPTTAAPVAPARLAGPPAPKPPVQPKKLPPEPTAAKRPGEEPSLGLPSGATWATQALSRAHSQDPSQQHQPPVPITADESSWPSLADSTAAIKQRQVAELENNHRRSTSISTTSMDRVASTSSLDAMSQDPVVPAEQLGLAHTNSSLAPQLSLLQSAQVSTVVHGITRNVHVAFPGVAAPAEQVPEAASVITSLHNAVKAGTLGSKDAAAQLVALLKQREKENGRAQSLLAAGKAPPGFAPAVQPLAAHQQPQQHIPSLASTSGAGSSLLNPTDSPVVPAPPMGRYQPIGPIGQQGLNAAYPAANPQPSVSAYGAHHAAGAQANGTYSLWSGLPGIDLTASCSPLQALWNGAFTPSMHTVGGASTLDPPITFQPTSSAAVKAPPPGFGGPVMQPNAADGMLKRPVGSRYNPLEFSTTAPRPAMPAAYRPQLGTGL